MKATTIYMALSALLALTLAAHAAEEPVKPQSGNPPRITHGRITKSNLEGPPARGIPTFHWFQPADPRHNHPEIGQQIIPIEDRYLAKPLVDEPMRNPSICRGPDGTFYLIGATPRKMEDGSLNWDYGNAIRMWKSADLKSWESRGVVWDLNTPKWTKERGNNMNWLCNPRGGGYADSLRHTWNVTGPRIYYFRDTFWIAFSCGDQGTGLLKSDTGKAEGPYILWGKEEGYNNQAKITMTGTDPSLFVDDDGAVYWLWSPAWIARMKDDLTGLAESPRLLTCTPAKHANQSDVLVGRRGPTLYKANGVYHLAAAELTPQRLGIQVEDTLMATSKGLFGPYSKRVMMIKHGGPISVFQDGAGKYWATVCGSDRYAAVRDRAGIVPLEWLTRGPDQFVPPNGALTVHPFKVFTERGPWHKLLPLFIKPGLVWRDQHVMQAPDGYFYVSGSACVSDTYKGKLAIYRSRDLKEWEEIIVRSFDDEEIPADKRKSVMDWYWSASVNWIPKLKTYAINYETFFTKEFNIKGVLLSTTGRGEGPYKRVGPGFNCGKFLQDDDAQLYVSVGSRGMLRLNDDFSVKERLPEVFPRSGARASEDCNCCMVKMFGKYIFCTITCNSNNIEPAGEYGYAHMQGDSPKGPWGEWTPGLRHAAWGQPFRGLDGHWYASTFSEGFGPNLPHFNVYLFRLKTEFRDGQVLIDIDEDWTPDDYVPVNQWKGQGEFNPHTDTAPGPNLK